MKKNRRDKKTPMAQQKQMNITVSSSSVKQSVTSQVTQVNNLNVFERFVEKHLLEGKKGERNECSDYSDIIRHMSSNPSLTENLIKKYPDEDWDYFAIAKNPKFYNFIKENPQIKWDEDALLFNPTWTSTETLNKKIRELKVKILILPINELQDRFKRHINDTTHVEMSMLLFIIESRSDIKKENVLGCCVNCRHTRYDVDILLRMESKIFKYEQLKNQDRNTLYLSANPCIFTTGFLEKNLNLDWNRLRLSKNTGLTEQFIIDHPEIDWDLNSLGTNPNLSPSFLLAFGCSKVNIARNPFTRIVQEEESLITFLCGDVSKLSSVYTFTRSGQFDRNLLPLVFRFL